MTSSALMRSFAVDVVTAMSGRVPVFIHLPWCQIHTAAERGSRGDRLLRSRQEWEGDPQELFRPLGHRDVAAALDHVHLRAREHVAQLVEMSDRKNAVLASPDDQRRSPVLRRARDPGVADAATDAADADARGERAHELGERRLAVASCLVVQLRGDPSRVVEAAAQNAVRRIAPVWKPRQQAEAWKRTRAQEERNVPAEPTRSDQHQRAHPRGRCHRGHEGNRTAHRVAGDMRTLDPERLHRCEHEGRIEGLVRPEVPHPFRSLALAEAGKVERDHPPTGGREWSHHRAPVLGPAAESVNEHDRIAAASAVLFEDADAESMNDDPARVHRSPFILLAMLFYYLCTVGEALHKQAYPQGAQSKDADVFKWVTLTSGSPAVCQREHEGPHRWRPDEGGDEERIVRGYAVLQWDKQGFDLAKRKPDIGEAFESRWGPSLVVERSDDPTTGTYLLLRIFPHGPKGKPPEIGTKRKDVPRELVGRI